MASGPSRSTPKKSLQRWERVAWVHDGNYKPGAEAIYTSFTKWATEYKLLSPKINDALNMPTSATNWLATLL